MQFLTKSGTYTPYEHECESLAHCVGKIRTQYFKKFLVKGGKITW